MEAKRRAVRPTCRCSDCATVKSCTERETILHRSRAAARARRALRLAPCGEHDRMCRPCSRLGLDGRRGRARRRRLLPIGSENNRYLFSDPRGLRVQKIVTTQGTGPKRVPGSAAHPGIWSSHVCGRNSTCLPVWVASKPCQLLLRVQKYCAFTPLCF